jgi:hypothetical protein
VGPVEIKPALEECILIVLAVPKIMYEIILIFLIYKDPLNVYILTGAWIKLGARGSVVG